MASSTAMRADIGALDALVVLVPAAAIVVTAATSRSSARAGKWSASTVRARMSRASSANPCRLVGVRFELRGQSHSTTCLRCRRFEFAAQPVQVVRHTACSPAHLPRDDARRPRAGEHVGHWHHRGDNAVDRRNDRRRLGLPALFVSLAGIGTEHLEHGIVNFASNTVNGTMTRSRVATSTASR